MAATWIKPLHINKGKTIAQTLADRTDYAENPEKTNKGKLIIGYECNPHCADEQFLLDKIEYEDFTGVDQGQRNIIAYHIRQSFKPGEVTPEEAQRIGYELAMRWTKGKHAFIVAVHTDRAHIHCHIIYNSTTLDCKSKFKNFWNSTFAVRRLSDIICAENSLSIITEPKPSKGQNYGKWIGDDKKLSFSGFIRKKIDEIIPSCSTYEDFIEKLQSSGFIVDDSGKHTTVSTPGQKRPTRLNTLKGNYTESAIRERIANMKTIQTGGSGGGQIRINLLVDIQAKIREGKGPGYEQWAKIFNLKQAAKTLVFLQENGIDSYEDLKKKSSSASGDFSVLTTKIKDIETRQKEISELQKYIGQYGKTRDTYAAYKDSGWSRDFYDKHAADIILNRAAKKYFDSLGKKKLPSMKSLKEEYATLNTKKKKLYSNYHDLKQNSRSLAIAKGNADRILGITPDEQNRDTSRQQQREDSREN
ncbi:MAG: relaxase/mobilization nuclease domain-containing protein [Oscillospiraceae bacterium]|nr:relaxase/mobilization nuclease domain-containing protein [Oscillospiraceae bacterium]